MELTIADGVVALVIIVSAMLAFNRGVVREVLAIGGWIVAALVAFYFAPLIAPLVVEAPYVGGVFQSSCTLTALASFAIVFGLALIVLSIFTPVLSSAVQETALAPVDRGFGFIFGVARGVLLVAVVYLLYDLVVTDSADRLASVENSYSIGLIADAADAIRERAPTAIPDWIQVRIDRLMGDCGAEAEQTAFAAPVISMS